MGKFALAVLVTVLLPLAAATSPVMDPTLPVASMLSSYPDPEGILDNIYDFCEFCTQCAMAMNYCTCPPAPPLRRPTFTPSTFYDHPDWPADALPVQEPSPEPEPHFSPYFADRQQLIESVVGRLEENATGIHPSTVQIHVEETYTPGDRIAQPAGSRRPLQRRNAPRPGGYRCLHGSCGKAFDRSCDLKRHQKTHQPRSERPHKCLICNEGFLYPKDRNRHASTHKQITADVAVLFCSEPGCSNVDGFSRKDNLLRHQRKQHPHLFKKKN